MTSQVPYKPELAPLAMDGVTCMSVCVYVCVFVCIGTHVLHNKAYVA